MGIALGMVFLLCGAVILQVRVSLAQVLYEELQTRGKAIASDVASRSADMILTNNLFALHELVRDALENNRDVRYIVVLGESGDVLAHTFSIAVPPDLLTANPVGPRAREHVEMLESEEGLLYDVAAPIFNGRAGTMRVGMSSHGVDRMVQASTRYVLVATALVSLIGVLAAYLLTLVLVRPLIQLQNATRSVAEGDFGARAREWSKDEIGQLTAAFNSMTASLQQMQSELQRKKKIHLQLLDKVMTAQEDERKRVARELHDETGQALTSLMIQLEVLSAAQSLDQARSQIAALRDLTAGTLDEVHRLSLELRPSVLDDWGLAVAIRRYLDDFAAKTGLEIDCQMVGLEDRFPARVETTIYRIVQEALTNVVRHAQARHVSIVLKNAGGIVLAIVEDDGVGFDVAAVMGGAARKDRLGLFGMQERAELLGGRFTVESNPGMWTTLFVEIPVEEIELSAEAVDAPHTLGEDAA